MTQKSLTQMKYGETGVVTELLGSRHDLNCLGIRKGKPLKMITRQPIKGPVVVLADGVEVAMGLEIAARVMVESE
ncbi:FeoA family protein [Methanofollis aquaemaris]|uniref:FeoA family protein n=1 Tax=Methanofollis aquaemaris TaxID=126734 RepID=UPI00223F553E|nr:FeoA family protein [Methanofollis aquaemaris]